jgi:hypothetical protein
MRKDALVSVSFLVSAVLLFASARAAVAAEEVYVATLTAERSLAQKKTALLTLTISQRATEATAEELRKAYDQGGSPAFFEAVRKLDAGEAHITGGLTSKIHYVRVFPGQNASRVIILTASPLYFPEDTPNVVPADSIGVIELEVTTTGTGRGKLAEAQKLRITSEGTFQVEAARAAPIDLEAVRRER